AAPAKQAAKAASTGRRRIPADTRAGADICFTKIPPEESGAGGWASATAGAPRRRARTRNAGEGTAGLRSGIRPFADGDRKLARGRPPSSAPRARPRPCTTHGVREIIERSGGEYRPQRGKKRETHVRERPGGEARAVRAAYQHAAPRL